MRVPKIESFKTLPEAIAGYLSVVASSIGCSSEQRDLILELKNDLNEWIERSGFNVQK